MRRKYFPPVKQSVDLVCLLFYRKILFRFDFAACIFKLCMIIDVFIPIAIPSVLLFRHITGTIQTVFFGIQRFLIHLGRHHFGL